MTAPLVETWLIGNRVNLYVLDALAEPALAAVPAKGRSIAQMWAHLHNVRLDWLKSGNPALLNGLAKLDTKAPLARAELRAALEASGERMAGLVEQGLAEGRVKGFKPHPTAFAGYLLAHEGYHRGEIGIAATAAGHPLDQKTSFGMWEWGVR
ncbi:MAG: DinB family protein [Dehalococcoidia bacterium]